jgi:hypothetical protein
MEKKIINKTNNYINEMKEQFTIELNKNDDINIQTFITFINNYPSIQFNKEDFIKRKRIKNIVPNYERCIAKRANGEQCTRRNKNGEQFCGTHIKGTPHGIIDINNTSKPNIKKIQVSAIDVKGIFYYIDKDNNVYNTDDVFHNSQITRIIGKYDKKEDGTDEIIFNQG